MVSVFKNVGKRSTAKNYQPVSLLSVTVVPDRIVRAFKRSGATQAVALDISKAFDRV